MHTTVPLPQCTRLLRSSFTGFIEKAFASCNPGAPFLPNWHINLIAEYLDAVEKGEITRLIINMPPRSLKSLCVSIAWPAWLLGHDPTRRILAASYSSSLSLKHSIDCRHLMQAGWYRQLFADARILQGENQQRKFVTSLRGYRYATSVGGSLTGEGGDFLIIDDPLNPQQAARRIYRERVNQWFDATMSSRLDDKKRGVMVLVMQRLHAQDLSGHLLSRGGWEHLCLPGVIQAGRVFALGDIMKEFGRDGVLHPDRENNALIERACADLGSHAFAAQYLQDPMAEQGLIIRHEWLRRYNVPPHAVVRYVQSWDTGIKAGLKNDASACLTFAQTETAHYLLHAKVFRLEYPDMKRAFHNIAEQWRPHAILIEDKGSGQQLLQDMRREASYPLIPIVPKQDKVSRLVSVSPMVEAGRLLLPENASWLAAFEQELLAFPAGSHDDQVDALSQYLNWIREGNLVNPRIRKI